MSHDWADVFVTGTQLRLHDGGSTTPGQVFDPGQTLEIVDVGGDVLDKDGDWPHSVTLRGASSDDYTLTEVTIDNAHIREAVDRDDVSVLTLG
jgi:hypothetical protein